MKVLFLYYFKIQLIRIKSFEQFEALCQQLLEYHLEPLGLQAQPSS